MSEHTAVIGWTRDGSVFTDLRYSRTHRWSFDGGVTLRGSASPAHVPVPLSDPAAVDPEEAFVAALASCHMLIFLHAAAKRGLCVERYEDRPSGYVTPEDDGQLALTRVVLRPEVTLAHGASLSGEELAELHDHAHHGCFLARALRAELVVEPRVLGA